MSPTYEAQVKETVVKTYRIEAPNASRARELAVQGDYGTPIDERVEETDETYLDSELLHFEADPEPTMT